MHFSRTQRQIHRVAKRITRSTRREKNTRKTAPARIRCWRATPLRSQQTRKCEPLHGAQASAQRAISESVPEECELHADAFSEE
jgi:hypothetical protein